MKLEEYVENEEFYDNDNDNDYDYEYEEDDEDDDLDYSLESDEDLAEDREKFNIFNLVAILKICSIWFIRIGMIMAIVLFVIFIVTGKIKTAFLYLGGLIIAFFFGYIFMFLLDFVFTKVKAKKIVNID